MNCFVFHNFTSKKPYNRIFIDKLHCDNPLGGQHVFSKLFLFFLANDGENVIAFV